LIATRSDACRPDPPRRRHRRPQAGPCRASAPGPDPGRAGAHPARDPGASGRLQTDGPRLSARPSPGSVGRSRPRQ